MHEPSLLRLIPDGRSVFLYPLKYTNSSIATLPFQHSNHYRRLMSPNLLFYFAFSFHLRGSVAEGPERMERTKQIEHIINQDLEDGECKVGYIIYILYQSMMRYGLERSYLLRFFPAGMINEATPSVFHIAGIVTPLASNTKRCTPSIMAFVCFFNTNLSVHENH